MCRQYRPIGLCGHDIPEWERFDPEDPRRCAKAALLAVQKYGTTEAAVRCEHPEVVCEHPQGSLPRAGLLARHHAPAAARLAVLPMRQPRPTRPQEVQQIKLQTQGMLGLSAL
ncbi:hypothetical protein NLG97_g9217 [Lecanicillium saksenae]|uniref:Uncharacterized protein n=1 Tax=Lecanicillium saksenae TaxID=468837 RepID=A0ACC1QIL5_9HYPO|nr:hypothetical protein NLG97_g9217 [Lecanicillium saksenae]